MNTDEIKLLLEKYYEGETSKEEETVLRDELKKRDSDPLFQADIDLFGFIDNEKASGPDDSFGQRLFSGIRTNRNNKIKGILLKTFGIAAAVLLLFGITRQFENRQFGELPNSFDDPVLAYNETKKALYTVSDKLNYGLSKLDELQKIDKAFESLNELKKLEKYSDMLNNLQ